MKFLENISVLNQNNAYWSQFCFILKVNSGTTAYPSPMTIFSKKTLNSGQLNCGRFGAVLTKYSSCLCSAHLKYSYRFPKLCSLYSSFSINSLISTSLRLEEPKKQTNKQIKQNCFQILLIVANITPFSAYELKFSNKIVECKIEIIIGTTVKQKTRY